MPTLSRAALSPALADPVMRSMNFLNEIADRYPDAISLAAGRPFDDYFESADVDRYLDAYRAHLRERGFSELRVKRALFQYGRTKGLIHELVARYLAVDEEITADPEALVVTAGCQEAIFLVLRALRADDRDVALAVAPTYAGFTGAARVAGMPVLPVPAGDAGVDVNALRRAVRDARADGLRPRCLYLVPDFANPSGATLGLNARRDLLVLAEQEEILLLEDTAYRTYTGGDERLPTLKALDSGANVVLLGSFAKTSVPGARVGFALADQPVTGGGEADGLFADELAKFKSMVTVNTSAVGQAVVAGQLLLNDFSLRAANRRTVEVCRRNRELVVAGLAERFGDRPDITWKTPSGGFFLVVTVPFPVDDVLLRHSAESHGVLWTPMAHFYSDSAPQHALRLSCSSLTPERIALGLDRLAAFVEEQAPSHAVSGIRPHPAESGGR